MARLRDDDDEDFWGRPSVHQRLELQRAQRNLREAKDWRMLIFCALLMGALAFWR